MEKLPPINFDEFIYNRKINTENIEFDYTSDFYEIIEKIEDFAITPFFLIIHSNYDMKIKYACPNINQFSSIETKSWIGSNFFSFIDLYHKEEQPYILSAINYASDLYIKKNTKERDNFKFNIYGRMYCHKLKKCTWTLLQISKFYVNKNNEIEFGLYVIYDLTLFGIDNLPLVFTVDSNNEERKYYKLFLNDSNDLKIPHITKREKEILNLMSKGFNTPEISDKLFISYYTVENHKRNLRKKTYTKTSSELMAFVMKYNLIL